MITSIEEFLRYFDAVHRRAVRDIGLLPAEAEHIATLRDQQREKHASAIEMGAE